MRTARFVGAVLLGLSVGLPAEPAGEGQQFVIAERGRSAECVIALPERPSPSQVYAAEEFRDHVRAMTDVTLAIARGNA